MAHEPVVGDTLICAFEFRLEGVLTDPTVVRCDIRRPSGGIQELPFPSAELQKVDVGQYEATVVTDEAGTWGFRATGIGVVSGVQEDVVNVAASRVL